MQSFGPLTLTANVLTQVSCSPSAATVYIGNDSPFDVLVSFAVSPPPLLTSANGTPDWPAVVQAFHHCVLPTPGNISSPQGNTFAGNVWLLPLNTRNTTMAQNGTVSATANAWVIACLPGEQPPDAYAAPRQTDITSQTRVIAVPTTSSHGATGIISITTTNAFTANFYTLSNVLIDGYLGASGGTYISPPPNMGPHWDGTTNVAIYLHALRLDLAQNGTQTAYPKYLQGIFGATTLDQSGNIIGRIPLNLFTLGSDNAASSYQFVPAIPSCNFITPQINDYFISFYVDMNRIQSQPSYVFFTFLATFDYTNTFPVPPLGQSNFLNFDATTGIF